MQLQYSYRISEIAKSRIDQFLTCLKVLLSLLKVKLNILFNRKATQVLYQPALIKEFQKGLTRRNSCILMAKHLLETLDKLGDQLPESAKINCMNIRRSLNSWGDFRGIIVPPISEELDTFHPNRQITLKESDAILTALRTWTEGLHATNRTLIRLQRYLSVLDIKISTPHLSETLSSSTTAEIERIQQINQEILAYEVLLKKSVLRSTPPNIQIEPTNRCNAKCKPCPQSSGVEKTFSDFDSATLAKIPHVLSAAQFVEFLGLGEPSIAPSLEHLVSLCQNQGCETHIITNGTKLLQNPAFKSMKKIGISWDGDCKETFEAIRVGIDFDSLIKSIKIFRAHHPDIFMYFACTINRANLLQIPGMVTLARDLNLNAITFHLMAHSAIDFSDTVLKIEDIEVYQDKIEEGRCILQGSNTLLFDYGILERLESEKEPLDPSRQLVKIKAYTPSKKEAVKSISQTIEQLKRTTLELYPKHSALYFKPLCLRKDAQSASQKHDICVSSTLDRNVTHLEKYAAELKKEVLAAGAAGLNLPHCTAAWSRLVVKADGRMFPCCSWSHDYANLKEIEHFDTSWNGNFHLNLRDAFSGSALLPHRCQKCTSSDKYQGLTEILRTIRELGINYDEIPKQPGFNPPPGKLEL